jgi:uncharacterized membrane protein YkoI
LFMEIQIMMRGTTRKNLLPLIALVAALVWLGACSTRTASTEISREQAIEIARKHVTFEVRKTEAESTTQEGRPVWRVTFRGQEMAPGREMGEVSIVVIDRTTGEMVSLGMS